MYECGCPGISDIYTIVNSCRNKYLRRRGVFMNRRYDIFKTMIGIITIGLLIFSHMVWRTIGLAGGTFLFL